MKNKVLFCATVDYHFKAFHLPYLKWFKEQGWEVHVAASGEMNLPFVDHKYNIPISRSPLNLENRKAFKELKQIINDNDYRIVHCHTPVAGVLARLSAVRAREKNTTVIYTAHGFHFCKGGNLLNWLIYYPIEKILAKKTDCLITINEEDFNVAVSRGFQAAHIRHVHGVGVNTDVFKPADKEEKRKLRELKGYKESDFILFYAAEFNKNKNQELLIKVINSIKEEVPNIKLLLAGEGKLFDQCKKLAKQFQVENKVDFLGYRKDIDNLLKLSDVAVSSSRREGLPVNVMEAMACGLPVIATDNRGHRELVSNSNGWLIKNENEKDFALRIKLLYMNQKLVNSMGINARKIITQKYSTKKVLEEKSNIYKSFMDKREEIGWAAP